MNEDQGHFIIRDNAHPTDKKKIFGMAARLREKIEPDQRPIILPSTDPKAPEIIAACWVAGIPVMPVPDKLSKAQISVIRTKLEPVAIAATEQRAVDFPGLPYIQVGQDTGYGGSGLEQADIPADRAFAYMFTSGSSGEPKLVRLTRANMEAAARASIETLKPAEGSAWILCLPLNHIGGCALIIRCWLHGLKVADFRGADYGRIARAIAQDGNMSLISLVPTQLKRLLDDYPSLRPNAGFRGVLLGGAPSNEELIGRARSAGIPVIKSYGMTETCAHFTMVRPEKAFDSNPLSSGQPIGDNQVEIRDETGMPVKAGVPGLIWLRGGQVVSGYIHPGHANNAFDGQGWLNTGDVGCLNESGELEVQMRSDDIIISGGEKINPAEVEAALHRFEGIRDCAVIGVGDDHWGQKAVAFVVCDDGNFDPEAWKAGLSAALPKYMLPKDFRQVDAIPKTGFGKLQRKKLLEVY